MNDRTILALRREVARQRRLVIRLVRILHTHMRTDLAPDAGLPAIRKLLEDVGAKRSDGGSATR